MASRKRALGVCAGVVGFGISTELLARKNIPAPTRWADRLKRKMPGDRVGLTCEPDGVILVRP